MMTPEIEGVAHATDLFPRFLAQGYALAGVPERALHWLAIAVDRGFINYPFLAMHDPLLEKLRGEARFRRLMVTVRERWQNSRHRPLPEAPSLSVENLPRLLLR